MSVAGKKVLMVLPPTGFEEEEYDKTRKILEGKGAKVTVASVHEGEVRGEKGMIVKSTAVVGDVKVYDYDAIVFVGGEGARNVFEHEKVLKLAKDADHKVLGAISNATVILANAEVLKEKKATGDRRMARWIEARGGRYTGQPVQVDEKIVTADGPNSVVLFGNALAEVLGK